MESRQMDTVQPSGQRAEAVSTETRVGRRTFTAEYKRRILAEAAACRRGELGLMLRREGLYSSTLDAWRKQHRATTTGAPGTGRRGRKPSGPESLKPANERLRRENARLQEQLRQAELIIDVQKKLCAVLDLAPPVEVP